MPEVGVEDARGAGEWEEDEWAAGLENAELTFSEWSAYFGARWDLQF